MTSVYHPALNTVIGQIAARHAEFVQGLNTAKAIAPLLTLPLALSSPVPSPPAHSNTPTATTSTAPSFLLPQQVPTTSSLPIATPSAASGVIETLPPLPLSRPLTADGKLYPKLLDLLGEKLNFFAISSLRLRMLKPGAQILWSDICVESTNPSSALWLTLGELISAGLGITDLLGGNARGSYRQLREVFKFNPVDLSLSYRLFNLDHLRQFFGVTYEHLARDYMLGPVDYFVNLRQPLSSLGSFGLSIDTVLEWRKHFTQAFTSQNRPPPSHRDKSSERINRAMRNFDRYIMTERRAAIRKLEPPKDWINFLGLTLDHLHTIGVTHQDLSDWWLVPYQMSMAELLSQFGFPDPKQDRTALHYMTSPTVPQQRIIFDSSSSSSSPSTPSSSDEDASNSDEEASSSSHSSSSSSSDEESTRVRGSTKKKEKKKKKKKSSHKKKQPSPHLGTKDAQPRRHHGHHHHYHQHRHSAPPSHLAPAVTAPLPPPVPTSKKTASWAFDIPNIINNF